MEKMIHLNVNNNIWTGTVHILLVVTVKYVEYRKVFEINVFVH